ncbi:MAG TPA: Nramp family divalent metal transporter [Patescibacteria group bacterium]|nr:Nramp family divalent metal transporter [Patescibacteria group bacterium]
MGIRKLLGPSFIILALGLGSGEVILWPYLVSNYGLGIAWGAILGLAFQFFINLEIERYTLVKGESVFVGLAKLFRGSAHWFILSTFLGFGLPGIIAASAQVLASLLGLASFKWLAVFLLIVIGLILSTGKTVYGIMEKITKVVLAIGVPFIFLLALFLSTKADWGTLFRGLGGQGDGYWFLPSGIGLATFLAAFAYSGAGGNLNLTQSIYIKEKGYGMGKYAQKIVGLFRGQKEQKIKLEGEEFVVNEESVTRFRSWWRLVNWEHFLIFFFVGSLSIVFLMLLSFITVAGLPSNVEGIRFVINEGTVIGQRLGSIFGCLFLLAVSVMLFQTQLGVLDSTSRIMAENAAIIRLKKMTNRTVHLSRFYYYFVWAQILFGIVLFLGNIYEPKTLIVLGAVINAFAMFVHTGLVSWLNYRSLPLAFRPRLWRRCVVFLVFVFFGCFSTIILLNKLGLFTVNF